MHATCFMVDVRFQRSGPNRALILTQATLCQAQWWACRYQPSEMPQLSSLAAPTPCRQRCSLAAVRRVATQGGGADDAQGGGRVAAAAHAPLRVGRNSRLRHHGGGEADRHGHGPGALPLTRPEGNWSELW
jgi:hypothetical protein